MSAAPKPVYEIEYFPHSTGHTEGRTLFKPTTHVRSNSDTYQLHLCTNISTHLGRDRVATSESGTYCVSFNGDEAACFRAPFVEIVWVTPHPNVETDDLTRLVSRIARMASREDKKRMRSQTEHQSLGLTWGRVVGADIIVYITGLSSPAACEGFTKTNGRIVKAAYCWSLLMASEDVVHSVVKDVSTVNNATAAVDSTSTTINSTEAPTSINSCFDKPESTSSMSTHQWEMAIHEQQDVTGSLLEKSVDEIIHSTGGVRVKTRRASWQAASKRWSRIWRAVRNSAELRGL